jgi:hypothetical protein
MINKWRDAVAAFQCVADQATGGASAGHGDQKRMVSLLKKVGQHTLGYSRFKGDNTKFRVEMDDLVHS